MVLDWKYLFLSLFIAVHFFQVTVFSTYRKHQYINDKALKILLHRVRNVGSYQKVFSCKDVMSWTRNKVFFSWGLNGNLQMFQKRLLMEDGLKKVCLKGKCFGAYEENKKLFQILVKQILLFCYSKATVIFSVVVEKPARIMNVSRRNERPW